MHAPAKPLKRAPLTLGEIMALPEEEQKAIWRASAERVFAQMAARDEAYLDFDYQKTGSRQNSEWGE
jgi:hypothetical protein